MATVDAELELLRRLVEGTATDSGDKFFQSLVRHLAGSLGVRFAFVAEFADASTRVRTLAFWSGDKLRDNFEYDLAGTPCEEVVRGNICHHPQDVAPAFPNDSALVPGFGDGVFGSFNLKTEEWKVYPLPDVKGHVWICGTGSDALFRFDPKTEKINEFRRRRA